MKLILRYFLYLLILIIALIATFLIVLSLQDYRPEAEEILYQTGDDSGLLDTTQTYTLITWNIGYGGLGSDMDFFYDGGSGVRTDQTTLNHNLEQIVHPIQQGKKIDFWFIQELDVDARRSYYVNQFEMIKTRIDHPHFVFAKNYDVAFVPVPISNPMGKVVSGIATLSRYKPFESVRHGFPGNYSWPKHLFLLDRCFILNRYRMTGNKEIVLINTHNSAYDDGSLREEQLGILRDIMIKEYEKGNYVIAGGDWNMNPPGFDGSKIIAGDTTMVLKSSMDENTFPIEWTVAYDPRIPTNRDLSEPYLSGSTPTTIIDFFVCSPNIKVNSVKGINWGFEVSDHNPVMIRFSEQ